MGMLFGVPVDQPAAQPAHAPAFGFGLQQQQQQQQQAPSQPSGGGLLFGQPFSPPSAFPLPQAAQSAAPQSQPPMVFGVPTQVFEEGELHHECFCQDAFPICSPVSLSVMV